MISAKDLAEKLNISAATVSMVLNNKPGISEKTRKKVLEAVEQYGLDLSKKNGPDSPKGTIRFIIYKKHGTIVTDTPFFSQVTEGIDMKCRQSGYNLQLSYYYEGDEPKELLKDSAQKDCAGVLLLGTEMTEADFAPFSRLAKPLVILDTYFEGIECDTVLINNVQGAFLGTNFLIDKGHTQVGYLRSDCSIGNFEERADGYYKALRHHGLPTGHSNVFRLPPVMDGAYQKMLEYLNQELPQATAYFADNDLIAAGAMRAFKEKGLTIPDDISIIGFDNLPISEFLEPALTTMNVPKQTMGMLAVERLDLKIGRRSEVNIKIEVSTKLIERQSVCSMP